MVIRCPKLNGAEKVTPSEGDPAGIMVEDVAAPVKEVEVVIPNLV